MSELNGKEQNAIKILRAFAPKTEPYHLCYSGGKDSDVIRILAKLADVQHEIHHNLTTADAPETYRDTVEVIDASKTNKVEKIGEAIWNTTEYETVVIYQNKVYTVDDEDSYYAAKMHLNQPAEAIIEVRGDKVRVKEVLP